jgi:hypothetical protein
MSWNTSQNSTLDEGIESFVDAHFARETAFLGELVKIPTDNPTGDCAAHCRAHQGAANRARIRRRGASGAGRAGREACATASATVR